MRVLGRAGRFGHGVSPGAPGTLMPVRESLKAA